MSSGRQEGDFWGVERPVDPAKPLTPTTDGSDAQWRTPDPIPKAPRRKRWLWITGSVLGTMLIAVAGTPTVVGWLAPSMISSMAATKGTIEVESASFGWISGQRVGTTIIKDPDGKEVARFSLTIRNGMLTILSGGFDLGGVDLTGKASIIRYADGTTNLDRALEPLQGSTPPGPGREKESGAMVPAGLNVKLEAKGLDVTYEDRAHAGLSLEVKDAKLSADVRTGKALTASFSGTAVAADGATGTFRGNLSADQWSDERGRVTAISDPGKATAEFSLDLSGVPTNLLDAVGAGGGKYARAFGNVVNLKVDAKGNAKQADATIEFKSQGASAKAVVRARDGVVESVGSVSGAMSGAALASLIPAASDLTAARKDRAATLAAVPDVAFTADKFRLKLPDEKGADLRGLSIDMTLTTSAVSGTVVGGVAGDASDKSAFAVAPATITISTDDLARGARVKVATSATIDGKPAGTIDVDLALSGMLDPSGKPIAGLPGGIEGKALATGVATAIAQPFLSGLPVDLPADAGPVIDVEVVAKSASTGMPPGRLPPADIDLRVRGDRLNASGQFSWASTEQGGTLRTRGEGFRADVATAGQIVQRAMGTDSAWALAGTGALEVSMKDITLPLTGEFKPLAGRAAGQIDFRALGWTIRPVLPDDRRGGTMAQPVQVQNLAAGVTLSPGSPAVIVARGAMNYESQPFALNASLKVPGLLTDDPAKPVNLDAIMGAAGNIDAADVPTGLMRLVQRDGASDKSDIPGLAREALGPTVSLNVVSAQVADGTNQAKATIRSTNLAAESVLGLSKSVLDVKSFKATTSVTPALQRTIMARFAPGAQDVPMLAAPTAFELSIDPVSIPMKGLAPDISAAGGTVSARITGADAILFESVKIPSDAGGAPRSLDRVGVRQLDVKMSVPTQVALGAKGSRGVMNAEVTGQAIRSGGQPVGTLRATIAGDVAEYAPVGTLRIDANVKDLAAAFVDELTGKHGMVAGAAGDTLSVSIKARATPVGSDPASGTFVADAEIDAPRIKTDKPLRIDAAADRLTIAEGAAVTWTPDAAWLGRAMGGPVPASGGAGDSGAKITRISPVELRLNKAVLSRGIDASGKSFGLFKPGVFELDLSVAAAQMELSAADGMSTRLTGTTIKATRQENGIAFATVVGEVSSVVRGNPGKAVKDVRLAGKIESLADAMGAVDTKNLSVTAKGEIPTLPTQIVDTLADQKGLLVDLLGPEASVKVDADRFGQSGGSLALLASSDRAVVDLSGVVANKAFVGTPQKPGTAKVMVVTPQLSKRVTSVLGQFASFEKRTDQEPGLVTLSGLRLPLGEEAKRFDADVRIDPGVMNFELDPAVKGIMEAAGQKTQGRLGDKLGPLDITIRQGRGTLKPWTVPLGEFKLVVEGEFDLVGQNVNMVMWVPAGAIGSKGLSKAGGALGGIAGELLGKLAVGIRTTGTMGSPQHRVDAGLLRNPDGTPFRPEDLLIKGIGDLLKPKK